MKRKRPTLTERLAATLLEMRYADGSPVIDREAAKTMTAKEICSKFEFDHAVHVAINGSNHPSNLTARSIAEHAVKTAKTDIPQIAKTKRITAEQEQFRRRLLSKTEDHTPAPARKKNKIKSRPMDGTIASGRKKKMNGTVVRRT